MTHAEEHLQNFFDALQAKDALFSDIKKYLTLTQQQECLYVGRISVEAQLMGILSRLNNCESYKIKERISTNKIMKDVIITFKAVYVSAKRPNAKVKVLCRLIKEEAVRKTGVKGVWGVNASSFKQI